MRLVPDIERGSAEEIEKFQEHQIRSLLNYANEHSPFYKKLFSDNRIDIQSIQSLKDYRVIPTTSKDDLQQNNWDFLCVPKGRIVEYTSTSGTMGTPVTVALTESDLQRLAYNECISFTCADGTPDDLYQLMLTLDRQFMAGMAYYEGIRKLGAGLIRVGPGLPAMQWEVIERLKPTAVVAVPSFIIKLIDFAKAQGIDLDKSSVTKVICIGESLRTQELGLNALSKRIINGWNIKLYGTYASTEMQTAFTECGHGRGGHHHPELIYVELLDDNHQPVPEGAPGEITVSTLGVEAMPLLRYKTGDMAIAYQDRCACGRNTMRLGPVLGRKQHMIKLKGTTIYPPGIFEVIHSVDHIQDYTVEASTGDLGTDHLKLYLLVKDGKVAESTSLLREAFQSKLRVIPEMNFISQSEMEKLQLINKGRKPKKFLDMRTGSSHES
ncbi:MAG: AMP-binding protein [Chryseolinea sp.]